MKFDFLFNKRSPLSFGINDKLTQRNLVTRRVFQTLTLY